MNIAEIWSIGGAPLALMAIWSTAAEERSFGEAMLLATFAMAAWPLIYLLALIDFIDP